MGMTVIPCCVWYLSNTYKNVPSLLMQTHVCNIHAAHLTNLSRGHLVLLGYLPDNRVLQQLVRVKFTSQPKARKINETGGLTCCSLLGMALYF